MNHSNPVVPGAPTVPQVPGAHGREGPRLLVPGAPGAYVVRSTTAPGTTADPTGPAKTPPPPNQCPNTNNGTPEHAVPK